MSRRNTEPFATPDTLDIRVEARACDGDDASSVAESASSVVINDAVPACSFADCAAQQMDVEVGRGHHQQPPSHISIDVPPQGDDHEMSDSAGTPRPSPMFLGEHRHVLHRRSATEDGHVHPTPARSVSSHSRSRTMETPVSSGQMPVRSNPLSWGWLSALRGGASGDMLPAEEEDIDEEDPEVLRDMVDAAQKNKPPNLVAVADQEDPGMPDFTTPLSPISASNRDRFRSMLRSRRGSAKGHNASSSFSKHRRINSKSLSHAASEEAMQDGDLPIDAAEAAPSEAEEDLCVMCLLPLSGEGEEGAAAGGGGSGGGGGEGEEEEDDVCIIKPCLHKYHTACMFTFFSKCSTRDCPMCRGPIDGLEKPDGTFIERTELNAMFKVPCVAMRFRQVIPTVSAADAEVREPMSVEPSAGAGPRITATRRASPRRLRLPSDSISSFFTQASQVRDLFHSSTACKKTGAKLRKVELPAVVLELLDSDGQVMTNHDPVTLTVLHSSATGTITPDTVMFEHGVAVFSKLEIEYTPDVTRPSLLAIKFMAQSPGMLVNNKSLYVGVRTRTLPLFERRNLRIVVVVVVILTLLAVGLAVAFAT